MASGFVAKEWKQRISEFATRRLLSIVSQSSSSITVDVSRQEGLVSQVGDAFSPENMNGLEQRIAGAFANVDADVTAAKKSASDGKTLIAAAITAKKVAASGSDTFAVLAQKIGKIVLGSGNATKADVLAGKTFTNNDGVQYTGTMPNRGSFSFSSVNNTGSGAAGYYSGVTVDTRPSYTSGYNQGVTDADGRANANSVNYKTGYNKGVTDADARANPASVNYKSGYNAGKAEPQDKYVANFRGGSHYGGTYDCILDNYNSGYVSVSGNTITFLRACTVVEDLVYNCPSIPAVGIGRVICKRVLSGNTATIVDQRENDVYYLRHTFAVAKGATLKYQITNDNQSYGYAVMAVALSLS